MRWYRSRLNVASCNNRWRLKRCSAIKPIAGNRYPLRSSCLPELEAAIPPAEYIHLVEQWQKGDQGQSKRYQLETTVVVALGAELEIIARIATGLKAGNRTATSHTPTHVDRIAAGRTADLRAEAEAVDVSTASTSRRSEIGVVGNRSRPDKNQLQRQASQLPCRLTHLLVSWASVSAQRHTTRTGMTDAVEC
jgi:hypothetical protein